MKSIIALSLAIGLGASGVAAAQSSPPTANPNAPQNSAIKAPDDMRTDVPAAGRNSFTMGEAREHMEKAGYAHVMGLMKDHDGLWQGHAMKDGKPVSVAMDFQGNVVSR
jgi:hypothetical protein